MKKIRKLAIVTLLLVVIGAFAAAFTACGDKVTEISIANENMPQVVFVQGNDLDLSSGKLTVINDGKTEEIALDSEGITVTGFDKNTLGEQELTISYKGKSTTLKVNVVAGLVVANYESNYFVGEAFNTNKGRLTATRKNGVSVTASLNDAGVTISGFDSSSAGKKTVTATYSADGEQISGTFSVEIFDIDESQTRLTRPNKNSYASHETQIDLAGGYLTLKNAAGTLTKRVELTESMISGFDPSVATYENLNTPLKQTVTVNYAGTRTFEISVTYSYVSLMQLRAKTFENVDFTDKNLVIGETEGKQAVEAVTGFLALDDLTRDLVPEEQALCVARAAAIYGKRMWEAEAAKYQRTFYFSDGNVYFNAESNLDDVIADYNELSKTDNPLKILGDTLKSLATRFMENKVNGEDFFNEYLAEVYGSDYYNYVLTGIEYARTFNTLLLGVTGGTNTDVADLVANKRTEISSLLTEISRSQFSGESYGDDTVYMAVSSWSGIDLFDLFTQYCYTYKDVNGLNILKDIYLPKDLELLAYDIMNAYNEYTLIALAKSMGMPIVSDNTEFLSLYHSAVKINGELKNKFGSDPVLKWMYENVRYDISLGQDDSAEPLSLSELLYAVRTTGYEAVHTTMLGDKDYGAVWDKYFELRLKNASADGYGAAVEDLLKSFVDLSPSAQYAMLSALYTLYGEINYPEYALDFVSGKLSGFTKILGDYYCGENGVLPENTHTMVAYLLRAVEDYARRYEDPHSEDVSNFNSFIFNMALAMGNRKALLEGVEATEDTEAIQADPAAVAVFDEKFGYIYEKYLEVLQSYNNDGTQDFDFGDYENDVKAVAKAAMDVLGFYSLIEDAQSGVSPHVGLISAFEILQKAADKILSSGDPNIIFIYNYCNVDIAALAGQQDYSYNATLEYMVTSCRKLYVSSLANTLLLWEEYQSSEAVKNFVVKSFDVMYLLFENLGDASDVDKVIGVIKAFHSLSEEEQMLFVTMDARSSNYYYLIIGSYFDNLYAAEGGGDSAESAFADNVLFVEMAYNNYRLYKGTAAETSALNSLKKAYTDLQNAYNALNISGDPSKIDNYLFVMYNYYIELCAELVN